MKCKRNQRNENEPYTCGWAENKYIVLYCIALRYVSKLCDSVNKAIKRKPNIKLQRNSYRI